MRQDTAPSLKPKYIINSFEVTSLWSSVRHFCASKAMIFIIGTIITDKDPEIVTPTPPNFRSLILNLFMVERAVKGLSELTLHSLNLLSKKDIQNGRLNLPKGALFKARIWLCILVLTVSLSFYLLGACVAHRFLNDVRWKNFFAIYLHFLSMCPCTKCS